VKLTTVPEYLKAIANGPISQPNGYTCQSTCIAAVIGGDVPIMTIRDALSQIGEPGSPDVMGQYLTKFFGDRYSFHSSASINDIREHIKSGCVDIIHGWFTRSGHVVIIDGDDTTGFRMMDPNDEFHADIWDYPAEDQAFQGVYSDLCIYAACIAGESRDDAQNVYAAGAIDRTKGGAWVHRIKPGVG